MHDVDWRRWPLTITTTGSILPALEYYFLSRISRHATTRLVAIPLAVALARTLVGCVVVGQLPRLGAALAFDRQGRRRWGGAACQVIRIVAQVYASRMNPVWVWASADLLIPFLNVLRPSAGASHPPSHPSRQYAAIAVTTLATVWVWQTEMLSSAGLFLTLLSTAAEVGRQWLVRQEAEEAKGRNLDEAVEALRDSSLRTLILYLVVYLALFPLGLHNPYQAYSQQRLRGYLIAWPILAFCSSVVFDLALERGMLDFGASVAGYSASNACILVLVALTGWQNPDTATYRFVLFVLFVLNVVGQLVPARMAGIALDHQDVELAHEYAYDSLEPASRPGPSDKARPSRTRLALVPPAIALLGATYLALAPAHTLDIVIAHYGHSPSELVHHIAAVRMAPLARQSRVRVHLYEKGHWTDEELHRGLSGAAHFGRGGGDVIVRLPNAGREGGTYLEHIVAHYNASLPSTTAMGLLPPTLLPGLRGTPAAAAARPFADTTLFLQEHMAWDHIAGPRLRRTLSTKTAFVSLGPYLTNLCGLDSEVGTMMSGIRDIFDMVKGRPCDEADPDDRVLSTWAGQFAASRQTLLRNPLSVYERLRNMIEAPDGDPIHQQYNPSGPSTQSDPAFGHALERSWPLLLHCDDARIAETCRDVAWEPEQCQCFEESGEVVRGRDVTRALG